LLFLPAVLFAIWSITDHYVLQNYSSRELLEAHFNEPSLAYHFIFKGSQLGFMAVMWWLIRQLNRFEKALKLGYSTIDLVDLRWLTRFSWVYMLSIVATFVLFLSQNIGWLPFQIQEVFGVVYGLLVASVFYLNYQGIQHYTLAQLYATRPVPEGNAAATSSGFVEPLLTEVSKPLNAEEQQLEANILALISSKKLYLAPKFNLEDLAILLGENRHKVSRIINAEAGRTFYDLINGYRVEHLKALLNDPKNSQYTILALGLDSGFNSKASLNRIFKSITGLTPREYLDAQGKMGSSEPK
jgi:AraC-like DNA-binding protein